jgi:DNA polymerase III delta prime subunit
LQIGKPLSPTITTLLEKHKQSLSKWLGRVIPLINKSVQSKPFPNQVRIHDYLKSFSPKLLLYGPPHNGVEAVALDLIAQLEQEKFYVRTLDLNGLVSHQETTESLITACFHELKRHPKHVLFFPRLDSWWNALPEPNQQLVLQFVKALGNTVLLATTEWELEQIPFEWGSLFPSLNTNQLGTWRMSYRLDLPSRETRCVFFSKAIQDMLLPIASEPKQDRVVLQPKPVIQKDWEGQELDCVMKEYRQHQLLIRKTYGAILDSLRKTHRLFHKLPEQSMDLERMQIRLHKNQYETNDDFMRDIQQIMNEFGTTIRSKTFLDDCIDMLEALTEEFVQQCWYFYLFKRFLEDREEIASVHDVSDVDSEPIEATQFPMMGKMENEVNGDEAEVESIVEPTPFLTNGHAEPNSHDVMEMHLSDKESDLEDLMNPCAQVERISHTNRERLVHFFVQMTDGYTTDQIHDIAVTLAGAMLENDAIDVDSIIASFS